MKNLIYFTLCVLFFNNISAQEERFKGTLNVGSNALEIFFNIKTENRITTATMDVPAQGAIGLGCDKVIKTEDSLYIIIEMIRGKFAGKYLNDSTISGVWNQGLDFALELKKVNPEIIKLSRPQHPKPTDAYISKDVIYSNADKTVEFGATITMPHGKGPFPSIVLINGSGQQNRDSEVFGHKPFAVLADFFTRNGFLVLRADDRGIGETKGDLTFATSADFAEDVKAHVDYLKRQKETDKKKIILIGHSEGGMIAPMVAASRNDIFASILLAAPGIPIIDLLTEQQGAVLRSSGISQKDVESFLPFFKRMAMAVNTSGDIPSAQKIIEETLQSYLDYAKPAVVASIIGITDEKSKKGYVDEMLNTFTKKWFDYFISYNPEENLSKMKGHVLAINGSKDIQVIADSNLKGIENALIKGGNKNYKILKMEGYNHLFQKCKKCNVAEYAELTETFSEEVMKEMLNWVRNLEEKNK